MGQLNDAIDTWLAGVRFSQHVAQDGSLVSVLAGKAILEANLRALTSASQTSRLDADTATRVETAIRTLSPRTFDWGAAFRRETSAVNVMLQQMARTEDLNAGDQWQFPEQPLGIGRSYWPGLFGI